ncbi:MAG: phosphoribosyltransferase [Actinobacteria bacterium]|nr:MAG: phosphoribosyltransferase [Actinomycetota bacterium]
MFYDRVDAGKKLAGVLNKFKDEKPVILAIPRGGVVVAKEVAKHLKAPLDLLILRKIGAPFNPELALGSVASKDQMVLNESVIDTLNVDKQYLDDEISRQLEEIKRRKKRYLQTRTPVKLEGRLVIIVDDGIATGSTALSAVKAVRQANPKKIILAVPVAPTTTINKIANVADEVVVLEAPSEFYAVGQFYKVFDQTTDEEVIKLLK